MVLWRCRAHRRPHYRHYPAGADCRRAGWRNRGRDRHGRLPRLYRHSEPRHYGADVRWPLLVQDHPGHHHGNHGRSLDASADGRTGRLQRGDCQQRLLKEDARMGRADQGLGQLPRLAGSHDRSWRFAQHWLLPGRRHLARIRQRHGDGPRQCGRTGGHGAGHGRVDGRGRLWRLLCAHLPARLLCRDGRVGAGLQNGRPL